MCYFVYMKVIKMIISFLLLSAICAEADMLEVEAENSEKAKSANLFGDGDKLAEGVEITGILCPL